MRTLSTEEIAKSYGGRQVVRGVSLEIEQGEVVGLLGPNGAGKTTSFYMIVGLVRPDEGRVLADGHDISRLPMYLRARNYGISYLPQEPSVFRKLTVQDNILAVLETQDGGLFDAAGTVQFRAVYVQDGRRGVMTETSRFVREDKRWTYLGPVDG